MKIKAVIILFMLSFSIISPVSVHLELSDEKPVLVALDICHITDAPLSAGSELPAVNESSQTFSEPVLTGSIESQCQVFSDLLISIRLDRPPKV